MIETGEKAEYRWTHLSAYEARNKALVLEEREAYSNLTGPSRPDNLAFSIISTLR